jgi:hypothetical protein
LFATEPVRSGGGGFILPPPGNSFVALCARPIPDPDWALKVRSGTFADMIPFASEALAEFVLPF